MTPKTHFHQVSRSTPHCKTSSTRIKNLQVQGKPALILSS
ncbi:unnamed protein product [Chondrus crispus]|uniref:Uncharacterized protein n=1 Tax=Chondrus crispus TaxID=2769 RepID=R7QAY7_CHOCR|nr:unnamed protein product [Chondrus crispus]CDF35677.1 unnamed protein product [Chondrus crispus]|eukprot:XP_005715496.1 unnamed protein product [Chondrus crispus]